MAIVKNKFIWGIFISILTIFAMSHNVSAISPVINLNNYTLVRGVGSFNQTCTWSGGDNYVNQGGWCRARINGTTRLISISSDSQYAFKANDLLVVYLFVWVDGTNTIPLDYQPRLNSFGEISSGFDVLGYNLIDYNTYYLRQGGDDGYINWAPNNDFNINFSNYGYFYRIYELTLRARSDGNLAFNMVSNVGLFEFNTNDSGSTINFSLRNAKQYRFEGDEANKEVEEKTQEAVDDSQAAGSGSSSSASQGGANLLSAITGFFNVITSAQPTNCRFNAPLNTYFGNQNLNVDLCALDLPSGIGALTSIIAIGILIPFAIHMFNKFIALFRSFQS